MWGRCAWRRVCACMCFCVCERGGQKGRKTTFVCMIVCVTVHKRVRIYICESFFVCDCVRKTLYLCMCMCVCAWAWLRVRPLSCQLISGDTLEGYYSLLPSLGTRCSASSVCECVRQRTVSRRLSGSWSVRGSLPQVSVLFNCLVHTRRSSLHLAALTHTPASL